MKPAALPKTGRPLGLLRSRIPPQEFAKYAVTHGDDGVTLVPLEDMPATCARIRTADWRRLTADAHRHPSSPNLTRTRWMLEGGEVRALSLRDAPRMGHYSYSVAALLLDAKDGDAIHLTDVLALIPEQMYLERKSPGMCQSR